MKKKDFKKKDKREPFQYTYFMRRCRRRRRRMMISFCILFYLNHSFVVHVSRAKKGREYQITDSRERFGSVKSSSVVKLKKVTSVCVVMVS
jgi:hypothetical protein